MGFKYSSIQKQKQKSHPWKSQPSSTKSDLNLTPSKKRASKPDRILLSLRWPKGLTSAPVSWFHLPNWTWVTLTGKARIICNSPALAFQPLVTGVLKCWFFVLFSVNLAVFFSDHFKFEWHLTWPVSDQQLTASGVTPFRVDFELVNSELLCSVQEVISELTMSLILVVGVFFLLLLVNPAYIRILASWSSCGVDGLNS